MLIFIILLSFLNSKELKFNFIDWNYDSKIEADSLNIRNIGLGIDTTLINPKSLDLEDLLVISNVENNTFGVNYDNNILYIKSEKVIEKVELIDILGKNLIEEIPNSFSFKRNINFKEEVCFLILTTENKKFYQRFYNLNQEIYKSASILMSENENWLLKPYKKNYRDTTFQISHEKMLDSSINLELKRLRYRISVNVEMEEVRVNYNSVNYNPSTGEHNGKDTTYITNKSLGKSLIIYNEKHKNFQFDFGCESGNSRLFYDSGYIEYSFQNNKMIAMKVESTNSYFNLFEYGFKDFNRSGEQNSCISEYMKIYINNPIEFIEEKVILYNTDVTLSYSFRNESNFSSDNWNQTTIENIGPFTISFTIERLD